MLNDLPRELFVFLARFLDCQTLARLRLVSRTVHATIDDACWRAVVESLGWSKDWSAGDSGLLPHARDARGLSMQAALRVAIAAQRSARTFFDECQTWQELAELRLDSERGKRDNRWLGSVAAVIRGGGNELGIWRFKPMTHIKGAAMTTLDTGQLIAVYGMPAEGEEGRSTSQRVAVPPYAHLEFTGGFAIVMGFDEHFLVYDCREPPSTTNGLFSRPIKCTPPEEASCTAYKARYPLLVTACADTSAIYVFNISTGGSPIITIPMSRPGPSSISPDRLSYIELDSSRVFLLDKYAIQVYDRQSGAMLAAWRSPLAVAAGVPSNFNALHHHNGHLVALHALGLMFLLDYEDVLEGLISFDDRVKELNTFCDNPAAPNELSVENDLVVWSAQRIHRNRGSRRLFFLQRLYALSLEEVASIWRKRPRVHIVSSLLPNSRPLSRLEMDSTAIYFPAQSVCLRRFEADLKPGCCRQGELLFSHEAFDEEARAEVRSWSWSNGHGDTLHEAEEIYTPSAASLSYQASAIDWDQDDFNEIGPMPTVLCRIDSCSRVRRQPKEADTLTMAAVSDA